MKNLRLPFRTRYLALALWLPTHCYAVAPLRIPAGETSDHQTMNGILFHGNPDGWTVAVDLTGQTLTPGKTLLELTADGQQAWLSVAVTQEDSLVALSLKTDYREQPLTVAVPVSMLQKVTERRILLRYRRNALDLYLDGVLVDQEWPLGQVVTGDHPQLSLEADHPSVAIWGMPVSDAQIESDNGGAKKIAARADLILGPLPEFVQYSRPRGWNTNAGDAMPYYHDGTFHLYFLQDRRQHHSKWGLGAHQWAHISSSDLVHWTHYPVALGIDHDWEGSICTGSVIFNGGKYYAFYATRMGDRSEHLAVAEGDDPVRFRKIIPSPFADATPPYVHGPNRDPFVFEAFGKFHMLVTAAVTAAGGKTQGALEHLTSADLSHWTVEPEPFLLSGTDQQPECSDLFGWRGWYYLLYSLSGVTHYKIAKSPLGPWAKPENDILDGPEAIVMKAAPFHNDRFLAVGFVGHDNRYGGDLVFRELVQEQDGSLGSKFPNEMKRPFSSAAISTSDLEASPGRPAAAPIPISGDVQLNATIQAGPGSRFAFVINPVSANSERLTFDGTARTVAWQDSNGNPERAALRNVSDLSGPIAITLIIHGTVADLLLNGHRTLVHRVLANPASVLLEAQQGQVVMTHITKASIR